MGTPGNRASDSSVKQMAGPFQAGPPRTETLLDCKMPYCRSTAASRSREGRSQDTDAIQITEPVQITEPKVAGRTMSVCERITLHEQFIEREKVAASKSLKKTGVSSKRKSCLWKSKRGKKKKSLRMNCNGKKTGKKSLSKRRRALSKRSRKN